MTLRKEHQAAGRPVAARCSECGADAVPERATGPGPWVIQHLDSCARSLDTSGQENPSRKEADHG